MNKLLLSALIAPTVALSAAHTNGLANERVQEEAKESDGPTRDQLALPADQELNENIAHLFEYDARIKALNHSGPKLNAIILHNTPRALAAAAFQHDKPLRGRAILVKDNIETQEFPTTAGSLALKDNNTGRDAPLIANIRKAGGVILGKTNLSEWANIRDRKSTSGWSAIGGLTRNPHAIDRNSCGSSSGSGAAVAAGLAWAAIGTETNGSSPARLVSMVWLASSLAWA